MLYKDFFKEVMLKKVEGFNNNQDFHRLLLYTAYNPDEMKIFYQDREKLEGNQIYIISKDVSYIAKGLSNNEMTEAYVYCICSHYMRNTIKTYNREIYTLQTLALSDLIIETFKLGQAKSFETYYDLVTEKNWLNLDDILDEIEEAYNKILSFVV